MGQPNVVSINHLKGQSKLINTCEYHVDCYYQR